MIHELHIVWPTDHLKSFYIHNNIMSNIYLFFCLNFDVCFQHQLEQLQV